MKFTREQVIKMAIEADGGIYSDHINIDAVSRLCTLAANAALTQALATTEPTKAELIAQARDLIEAQEHAHEVGYRMGFAAATERKGDPVRALYDEDAIRTQAARIAELEAELETERMRLSACGVIALANTPESATKARDMHPDYMSGSAQDVMAAVDREMALRAEVERLRKPLTDEQIEECEREVWDIRSMDDTERCSNREFARAIEAAKDTPCNSPESK